MHIRLGIVFFLATVCVHAALAGNRSSPPRSLASFDSNQTHDGSSLDTAAIHALYMDGEFDPAIEQLERASAAGLLKSHGDSVFAYKHLGVMYAARYETMEKGKSYMYRLLTIEPSVKILDMYASEMIYMIFRNVQAEFEIRTIRLKNVPSGSASPERTDSAKDGPVVATHRHRTWPYWTAGALAAAGTGLTAYFLLQDGAPRSNHYSGGL